MNPNQTVCLLNDSFPPLIDGVANTVVNYARIIMESGGQAMVVTPHHPDARDSIFSYPVVRYPSIDTRDWIGYLAGIPFSPDVASTVTSANVAVLHSHCPIVSTILARQLRPVVDAPLILTYHTKFDIEVKNIIRGKLLQEGGIRALVNNISACDEVWVVSQGAGDNLRSLGYEGDYIVMPNGVDIPRGKVSPEEIAAATQGYDLPAGVPLFLFVGRMQWYKGQRIILDALAKLAAEGMDFRMVFVGNGADFDEIQDYARERSISDKCFFTGSIQDRAVIRAWYSRADLFLFPSTFDTNGLVVREAAACDVASVLIAGSCASEGVQDGQNGFLIEENWQSLYQCLSRLLSHPEVIAQTGRNAGEEIYVSWESSIQAALKRYDLVIDRYRSGMYPPKKQPMELLLKANGELMDDLSHLIRIRNAIRQHTRNLWQDLK